MPQLIRPTLAMAIMYVSTLTLGAQTTPTTPAQSSASAETQITVTGCLQAAEPSPTGTRGPAAGADASDAKFMLTKIERAPDTTATTGASSRAYRLIANPAALTPHVGKKLELTGVVETAGGGATTPSTDKNADAPALRVVSGKVVAVSCEGPLDR